jgi:hypothetical protein
MLIFSAYLLALLFLRAVTYRARNGRDFFVVGASFLLWLLLALRSTNFGPDVPGYVTRYESLPYVQVSDILRGFGDASAKDPMFWVAAKFLNMAGFNAQLWLAAIAALFCFAIGRLFSCYSTEPLLGFLALVSLNFLYFTITGLRQAVAVSFVIIAYTSLRNRRVARFVLLVVLGSLFHSSALVFLLAYPLSRMRLGWRQFATVASGIAFATLFQSLARKLIRSIGWSVSSASYADRAASLSWSGFAIQALIVGFWLLHSERILRDHPSDLTLLNLMVLGLAFLAFATVLAESFRLAIYFTVFSSVAIPRIISGEPRAHHRAIMYGSVSGCLIAYFFYSSSYAGFALVP